MGGAGNASNIQLATQQYCETILIFTNTQAARMVAREEGGRYGIEGKGFKKSCYS